MDGLLPLAVATVVAIFAFLFKKSTKKKEAEIPPKNTTASVARETVQQTFEEEVGAIKSDVEGSDPAGDLADRGNTRSRK